MRLGFGKGDKMWDKMHEIDLRAVVFMLATMFCGCGGDDTSGNGDSYIRGEVTITKPQSGGGLHFDESCHVSSLEEGGEIYWGIEAKDMEYPFGVIMTWKQSLVTGPDTFQLGGGTADVSAMFIRAHPTEPGTIRMSGIGEGSVTFSAVGYDAGDVFGGTFESFLMERSDPDDTITIEMDSGSFRCQVD